MLAVVTQHFVAVVSEFICISSNSYKSKKWRNCCISLYVTMTLLPDNVIVMVKHNGRVDGDT